MGPAEVELADVSSRFLFVWETGRAGLAAQGVWEEYAQNPNGKDRSGCHIFHFLGADEPGAPGVAHHSHCSLKEWWE